MTENGPARERHATDDAVPADTEACGAGVLNEHERPLPGHADEPAGANARARLLRVTKGVTP
jgi:hypothetical protein